MSGPIAPATNGSPAEPDPVSPEPEFQVLEARPRRYAAVPTLDFDVHVSEPGGRAIYLIALTAQVMIEPARRRYDTATQEKLVELFGPADRWATTTRSLVWTIGDVLVDGFTGSTTFRIPIECSYDLELAAAKYFYALPDGEVPLAFNFNGKIHYRSDDGIHQVSLVPWSASAEFRMPIKVWRDLIEEYYPKRGWVPVHSDTLEALHREKERRGSPTFDACVTDLLEGKP